MAKYRLLPGRYLWDLITSDTEVQQTALAPHLNIPQQNGLLGPLDSYQRWGHTLPSNTARTFSTRDSTVNGLAKKVAPSSPVISFTRGRSA
jgi:hypothetical protein